MKFSEFVKWENSMFNPKNWSQSMIDDAGAYHNLLIDPKLLQGKGLFFGSDTKVELLPPLVHKRKIVKKVNRNL